MWYHRPMSTVVTLAERHRRRLAAMTAALEPLDTDLAAYARRHGGRFIRYGSTATGCLRISSDVDLIADFPDQRATIEACRVADELCASHGLTPDSRPASWAAETLLARALAEGMVLS